jgi:hypothetical protein
MGDMFDDDNDDIIASIRCEIQREIPTLSQLKEHLSDEIADPEIKILSNFRRLSLEQLDTFNVDTGLFEIPDQEGEEPAMKMQRNVHVRRSYHYKIGQYKTSWYYVNYLSDKMSAGQDGEGRASTTSWQGILHVYRQHVARRTD